MIRIVLCKCLSLHIHLSNEFSWCLKLNSYVWLWIILKTKLYKQTGKDVHNCGANSLVFPLLFDLTVLLQRWYINNTLFCCCCCFFDLIPLSHQPPFVEYRRDRERSQKTPTTNSLISNRVCKEQQFLSWFLIDFRCVRLQFVNLL